MHREDWSVIIAPLITAVVKEIFKLIFSPDGDSEKKDEAAGRLKFAHEAITSPTEVICYENKKRAGQGSDIGRDASATA